MIKVILLFSAVAALLEAQRPVIASISACSPTGAGGQGSCPRGTFDTHQMVLGPGAVSVNKSSLGVGAAPDEHSTVFAPGTLGGNQEYLFFVSSAEGGTPGIGVGVLSGGAGPNHSDRWTLDFPKADGYGSYASGFGQVFNTVGQADRCPVVADGNPAHQDQTFDIHYASGKSVVKDPTAAPGALLMVYEGTNACIGNAGGSIQSTDNDYISLAIATSLDYGKTWPTYRGTPSFNFVPMPGVNQTQAPNAPMGALGKNVCMGNDCTTPPPAGYGRYPVVTGPTSLASLMGAAVPLTSKYGEQEISGFVDDVAGNSKPYIYANSGGVRIARAQLNGGTAPLTFQKWDGHAFASPGLGGPEPGVLPAGAFENCEANSQLQFGSSISYVEDTQQYLLTFVCDSPGDPAAGQGGGTRGGAWFYSTTYDLSDQTQWTQPREIAGSWSEFDQSGGCPDYKGYYPSFVSLGKSAGHLTLTGYVFYLFGCQGGGTPGGRQMSSRAFTITTAPEGTPVINKVANAEGESLTIAPNTWVEIEGQNLAPARDSRIWQNSDLVGNTMPTQLDKVSVTVDGKSAYVYYISPTQVNVLTPPAAMSGAVQVVVTNNGTSASFTAQAQTTSPSFFLFNGGPYVAATHANGALLGPVSLYPGSTTPAKPNETIVLYANGFGPTSVPVASGSIVQSGSLSPPPVIKIGGITAAAQFAGLVSPGEFQFNVVVPGNTPNGDQPITATYNGSTTPGGTLIAIQPRGTIMPIRDHLCLIFPTSLHILGNGGEAITPNRGKAIYDWSTTFAVSLVSMFCLGTPLASNAAGQVSQNTPAASPDVTVNFVTAAPTPLNPGFNGFNGNMKNAVEYYDTNFQRILATLSPGWLRFPGGTDSEAFNWASGEIVPAWIDALAAKQYTHDINANAQPIVAGKGGASFTDFAAMAAAVGGAKIIVSVNAYTDTPQSAQSFAKFALTNHIPVAVWELDNEPYTWLNTDAGSPGPFFHDAADYATRMRFSRDAIKASDPNAAVSLYFSEAGHPDKAWDNALASYTPRYWDAVTYHEYVFSGTFTAFDDLMAAANASLYSNSTSYVTDYLAPKNNPGMTYVISEVSPAAGQGGALLGTLYGGIYTAEFALRMSTLPQVKYVAAFQMLSNGGVDQTNDRLNVVQAAYDGGTTINTSGLNFGFFVSAQAAGEAVANGALHNSVGVYATTTSGGPTVPITGGSMPAVYAQAYDGGNGKHHLVLTNKSVFATVARITQNGADLTIPMQMTFVTGTDPKATNLGSRSDSVQIQTQTVGNPGAVTIPPFSVVRLEWPLSSSISLVANAEGENPTIAPNAWVELKGSNLAPTGDSRIWKTSDFVNNQMPEQLDGVGVTVNVKSGYVYYISPSQVNILTPPDAMQGPVNIVLSGGATSASFTAPAQSISPSFFVFDGGPYIAATHANGALLGPVSLYPGSTTPAKPSETIVLYANGFGPTSAPVVSGSIVQSGSLSPPPVIKIGGITATVQFAGLVSPGEFQFNVVVPGGIPDGDQPIIATYNGVTTQAGTLVTIQH